MASKDILYRCSKCFRVGFNTEKPGICPNATCSETILETISSSFATTKPAGYISHFSKIGPVFADPYSGVLSIVIEDNGK